MDFSHLRPEQIVGLLRIVTQSVKTGRYIFLQIGSILHYDFRAKPKIVSHSFVLTSTDFSFM
jgi:hypothetical protein